MADKTFETRTVPIALLLILLLLCALLGALFFGVEAPPKATGGAHPDYATMQVGGDPQRHEGTLGLAFVFVALQIVLFVGLLVLAIGHRLERRQGWLWIGLGAASLLGAFVGLFLSYRSFMQEGSEAAVILGFPVPSAWMLYAVWPAPLFFIALFVVRFDDWILLPEDRKRFDELVAQRKGGD